MSRFIDVANVSHIGWKLADLLKIYGRGYYYETKDRCVDFLKDSKNSIEEATFQALYKFIDEWGIHRAHSDLTKVIEECTGEYAPYEFYVRLLRGWIYSIERMSFVTLERSIDDLNKTIRTYEDLRKSIKVPINGWFAYWFRANSYATLGNHQKAISDYNACIKAFKNEICLKFKQRKLPKKIVLEYVRNECPAIARMVHDRGMIFFELGDFDLALDDIGNAKDMDPESPYILSNMGFLYCCRNEESNAFDPLIYAYKLMENRKKEWSLAHANRDASEYATSGRIYYNLGLLAYKWLKYNGSFSPEERKILEMKISKDDLAQSLFQGEGWKELFEIAFSNYAKIKDPSRAMPARILYSDPLSKGTKNAGNCILWEIFYGMSDYIENLIQHEHSISDCFLK